ncbi:MAG: hypothetical protein JJV98_16790 [Desulfosarcina sp.]|nr:hypothetical protein [Desulfobacterales bacterium]
MIIRKAQVSARGGLYSGVVELDLVETTSGWTYRVDGMTHGPLMLTWHTPTPEKASCKLQDVYDDQHWTLKIIE